MEERIRPTKSGLFAIELLIAVGVFTLCAAICVGLFVRAEVQSREGDDLMRAVNEARSLSECFKASHGDLDETAALTGGSVEGGSVLLHYGPDWRKKPSAGSDGFELRLELTASDGCASASVNVVDEEDGEVLLSWPVSALEARS